jgi:hypothetical protein
MTATMQVKAPAEVSAFVSRILECCLEIRSVWWIGQDESADPSLSASKWDLLAFADAATLQRLRKATDLHRPDIDVLVVTDGDSFENAWGQCRLSGSLVRWAWREAPPGAAYYNESRWAEGGNDGRVVRVRRKALLLWQARGRAQRAA